METIVRSDIKYSTEFLFLSIFMNSYFKILLLQNKAHGSRLVEAFAEFKREKTHVPSELDTSESLDWKLCSKHNCL